MQAIVWWSVPLVAFLLALAWVSIANRERPPVDPHDSVAEHERFRQAMDRQMGRTPPGPTSSPEPKQSPPGAPGAGDDPRRTTSGSADGG